MKLKLLEYLPFRPKHSFKSVVIINTKTSLRLFIFKEERIDFQAAFINHIKASTLSSTHFSGSVNRQLDHLLKLLVFPVCILQINKVLQLNLYFVKLGTTAVELIQQENNIITAANVAFFTVSPIQGVLLLVRRYDPRDRTDIPLAGATTTLKHRK